MDPNETLARMLRAAKEIEDTTDEIERSMLADELACLVNALDGWIKAGGFLPSAWVPKRDTIPSPAPVVEISDFMFCKACHEELSNCDCE